MIVVSDSSPIIAFAAAGQLHLLHALFGDVYVPAAVRGEIAEASRPGYEQIAAADWIKTVAVPDLALRTELDEGESEAIVLVADLRADLLLIDERRGRDMAVHMGFRVTGVLSVLRRAKEQGLLPEIGPVLDDMIRLVQFRISRALYASFLRDVGEG